MSVTVIAATRVKPEAAAAFADGMEKTLIETRAYEGCISVYGYRDQDDPTNIIAIEQWETRDHYEAYVVWRRSTGTMDRLAAILQGPVTVQYFDQIA
jgi:quinol monooxygenase YgiN